MLLVNLPKEQAEEVMVRYANTDVFIGFAFTSSGDILPNYKSLNTIEKREDEISEDFWKIVYEVSGF